MYFHACIDFILFILYSLVYLFFHLQIFNNKIKPNGSRGVSLKGGLLTPLCLSVTLFPLLHRVATVELAVSRGSTRLTQRFFHDLSPKRWYIKSVCPSWRGSSKNDKGKNSFSRHLLTQSCRYPLMHNSIWQQPWTVTENHPSPLQLKCY